MMAPNRRKTLKVKKIPLSEEGNHNDFKELTPSERVAIVWQLTAQAWTFKDGTWNEPRLRRDIVRILRNRRLERDTPPKS